MISLTSSVRSRVEARLCESQLKFSDSLPVGVAVGYWVETEWEGGFGNQWQCEAGQPRGPGNGQV